MKEDNGKCVRYDVEKYCDVFCVGLMGVIEYISWIIQFFNDNGFLNKRWNRKFEESIVFSGKEYDKGVLNLNDNDVLVFFYVV